MTELTPEQRGHLGRAVFGLFRQTLGNPNGADEVIESLTDVQLPYQGTDEPLGRLATVLYRIFEQVRAGLLKPEDALAALRDCLKS